MIVPLLVAAVAFKAVGAFQSYTSGKSSAKAQRRLNKANADFKLREDQEAIMRTRREVDFAQGKQNLAVGASGFSKGSSLHRFNETTKRRGTHDLQWMENSATLGYNLTIQGGDASYRNNMARARIGAIGAAGDIMKGVAGAMK